MAQSFIFFLFLLSCIEETLLHVFPVNNFPDLLHVVGSNVLVINVVGVFPDVDG